MVNRWIQTISTTSDRKIDWTMTCWRFGLLGISTLILVAFSLTQGASTAWGEIVQTDDTSTVSEIEYDVSSTDLINAGQPTLDTVVHVDYVPDPGHNIDAINDGSKGLSVFVPDNNGYVTAKPTTAGVDVGGTFYSEWSSTFFLNLSDAPFGYDITSIQSISGWPDIRSTQRYWVSVAYVGDPTFHNLGTTFQLAAPFGTNSTRITITDTTGVIASNVEAIQFYFLTGGPAGGPPELVYREMDVFGVASISPPVLAGDYNDDDAVDAADYVAWRKNVGQPEGTLPNDINGGIIGTAQYETWVENFGDPTPGGGSSLNGNNVPEPTGALPILSLTVIGVLTNRRGSRGVLGK